MDISALMGGGAGVGSTQHTTTGGIQLPTAEELADINFAPPSFFTANTAPTGPLYRSHQQ